ncbi:hypothetical protein ACMXYX_18115 (plasmid) [Neptuniibacter sp. QD72_48]|uniref:hypothetical protein n=1 Tax=Neptuniibacter sp. QD72_48 TaxID=3398214 RepID=UPI0039F52A6D
MNNAKHLTQRPGWKRKQPNSKFFSKYGNPHSSIPAVPTKPKINKSNIVEIDGRNYVDGRELKKYLPFLGAKISVEMADMLIELNVEVVEKEIRGSYLSNDIYPTIYDENGELLIFPVGTANCIRDFFLEAECGFLFSPVDLSLLKHADLMDTACEYGLVDFIKLLKTGQRSEACQQTDLLYQVVEQLADFKEPSQPMTWDTYAQYASVMGDQFTRTKKAEVIQIFNDWKENVLSQVKQDMKVSEEPSKTRTNYGDLAL